MWLFDNGYIDNEVVDMLTAKAKDAKAGLVASAAKPRKRAERKPDEDKRHIISALNYYLNSEEFAGHSGRSIKDIEVTNVERVIAFKLGDDKYELTLSKKRKPKD